MALATTAAVVGTGSGVAVAAEAVFKVSPTSGIPGTVVDVQFKTACPRPAGSQSSTATVTLSQTGGQVVATATTSVNRPGRWSLQITVPVGTPAGAYVVSARCSTPSGTYLTYGSNAFTVTASPPPPPPPPAVTQISSDPFINPTSQHQTQVEPDTLADGNTIVSAFQSGRFTDGGSSDIGWATSTDGGATWSQGFLPSLTVNSTPAGTYSRVSDPSVAFDRRHGMWVISGLAMMGSRGAGVTVSRSADGIIWSAPVVVASTPSGSYDKEWAVCDTHPASPYYGNCYVTFDDNAVGDRMLNTASADGGLTWGPLKTTADNAFGFGGQPLVQPGGTVVVAFLGPTEAAVGAYRSLDGGTSWTTTTTVSPVSFHPEAGALRSEPLPTAEIDGDGRVFVAWSDCRFRGGCTANDLVMSSSTDGVS
ncbi:MAG: glycoside hydrolase, partial [Actinomycetota bacterium]|nr:glycoside hydrolase [Actinomycetota bacterium]